MRCLGTKGVTVSRGSRAKAMLLLWECLSHSSTEMVSGRIVNVSVYAEYKQK